MSAGRGRMAERRVAYARLRMVATPPPDIDVPGTITELLERTGLKTKDLAVLMGEPDSVNLRAILYRPESGRNMNRAYRMITVLLQLRDALEDRPSTPTNLTESQT